MQIKSIVDKYVTADFNEGSGAIILNVKTLNETQFYSTFKIKVRVAYPVIYVNCYSSNSKIKLNLVVNANTIL